MHNILSIYNTIFNGAKRGLPFPTSDLKDKILFYGKYSQISGGQMPNIYGEDYLTIEDINGSDVYTCPETTDYLNADTDNVWFRQDDSIKQVHNDDLVAYDFSRTIVKYDNDSPYQLREIIIIKSGATLTQDNINELSKYMQLSIFWSGTLNDNGFLKGNRGAERSVYNPELFTFANAASDSFGEVDAITGFTSSGLDGTGNNIFESQSSIKATGSYALHAEVVDTPTSGVKIYADLSSLLRDGISYKIKFKIRHTGTGIGINTVWDTGFGDTPFSVDYKIVQTYKGYTDFSQESSEFIYSNSVRYFISKEFNTDNDGGVYIDDISIQ